MAFVSIKNVFASAALATPEQFDAWSKLWRAAVEGGSFKRLYPCPVHTLAFLLRENESEDMRAPFSQALEDMVAGTALLASPFSTPAGYLAALGSLLSTITSVGSSLFFPASRRPRPAFVPSPIEFVRAAPHICGAAGAVQRVFTVSPPPSSAAITLQVLVDEELGGYSH